jgi:hypothetical protein
LALSPTRWGAEGTGYLTMFVIEDEIHAEQLGKFSSFEAAVSELRRFAAIAWDHHPNLAPCTSWQTCGREYGIIEYDTLSTPWTSCGEFVSSMSLQIGLSGSYPD